MILALDLAFGRIGGILAAIFTRLGFTVSESLVQWLVFSLIIVMVVGFVYVGETLSFTGVWAPGPILGRVFDVFIGLFNGWLVVGTWWYYSNALNYPMQQLGWFVPPISNSATALVKWLPQSLIPDQNAYLYIIAFLLFLLLLKVIR
jgi:hypothetical protein